MSCASLTLDGWVYLGMNDVVHDAALAGLFLAHIGAVVACTWETRVPFLWISLAFCLAAIAHFQCTVWSCHTATPTAQVRSVWLEGAALAVCLCNQVKMTAHERHVLAKEERAKAQ